MFPDRLPLERSSVASTILDTIASPSPTPDFFVVTNGLKSALSIPPDSRTAIFNLHYNAAVFPFVIRRAKPHAQVAALFAHGLAGVHEEVGKDLITQVVIQHHTG